MSCVSTRARGAEAENKSPSRGFPHSPLSEGIFPEAKARSRQAPIVIKMTKLIRDLSPSIRHQSVCESNVVLSPFLSSA